MQTSWFFKANKSHQARILNYLAELKTGRTDRYMLDELFWMIDNKFDAIEDLPSGFHNMSSDELRVEALSILGLTPETAQNQSS